MPATPSPDACLRLVLAHLRSPRSSRRVPEQDMFVNFMAPYQGSGKEEGQWVYDAKKIASNYLGGWFVIDLLSLLPFDLIGLVATSPEVRKLKAVRVVRLFRLLKLFRVFRAKRIMARWETLIDFNYKLVSLVKFACMMCAFAHWMSCVWMLAANINSACVSICRHLDDVRCRGWAACSALRRAGH